MSISGDWDRRISRRALLRTGGTLAAGAVLLPTVARAVGSSVDGDPFSLGIASGDPTPDGVVLWTRLAPRPELADGGMGTQRCAVQWEVALDEQFKFPVRRGTEQAVPEWAHSVHVEVTGLLPQREYFYRFKWGTNVSPVGRTRTAPPPFFGNKELTFAFVSCHNWANGYFNVYDDIVRRDPQFVVHLGDYIYEGPGGTAPFRPHLPAVRLASLSDFRIRHAQYKTDPDLQKVHAALPFFMTWDDHEVDNNYAGLVPGTDVPAEQFPAIRAAAYKAYYEHMPVRKTAVPSVGTGMMMFRTIQWGRLASFYAIDGRQYRSPNADPASPRGANGYTPSELDPNRTMLGPDQMRWLLNELSTTRAGWNVLANNKAFSPFDRDTALNSVEFNSPDNWDGYVADRQKILETLAERRTPNPIVLTGDSHNNWVRNVPPDFNRLDGPPVATEFMGTSLSTAGNTPNPFVRWNNDKNNPHLLFRNNQRGYVECAMTPQSWTSRFRIVTEIEKRVYGTAETLATFGVESGKAGAVRM
ncbi:alkaline phosphatase D family protein [Solirubrobacter phytolaccae]|uniref:Alkaline phosphatase D family protein n=1 Tax=Solirubrobacter phytolaccae TaxID=1404360 RepID=A0A9X3N6T3_9ACTN|nr:alkaline phosphatase D family protein [Solirubrobacter phytolaccae]MDA0179520.1 alkaline phosphatase D family protein [Solirubrobacter phytolaccae]